MSHNNDTSSEATPLLQPVAAVLPHPPSAGTTGASSSSSSGRRSYGRCISWENYLVAVEKYPIRTKCITAWIIFIAADTLAQVIEYRLTILDQETQTHPSYGGSITTGSTRNTNIDWIRAMRFGALGLFGAPWSHYYFQWLDHHLPPSEEPFTRRTAIKVGIDQFVQAPILLAIMIFSLSLMKGQGFNGARQDLTNTFMISLIANWKLWIPASIINIAFVKPSLRVLFVNVVFFFWTIILSLMLNEST